MTAISRLVTTTLAVLVGLGCALPAAAQWKWRDANGRLIYSDRPPPANVPQRAILERPPGMPASRVPPSPTTPSLVAGAPAVVSLPASAAASAPRTDPELEARRKKEADLEAAKSKAEESKLASAKAENCSRARGQLKLLDDGVRIARTNEKGEREILDDKGRAAEQARVRQTIASDCK
jgi:hypothetical protein